MDRLIGESIWNTYESMAHIIAEGPKLRKLGKGLTLAATAAFIAAAAARGLEHSRQSLEVKKPVGVVAPEIPEVPEKGTGRMKAHTTLGRDKPGSAEKLGGGRGIGPLRQHDRRRKGGRK